jgi:geranylgeranyl pyrophosphate synthase
VTEAAGAGAPVSEIVHVAGPHVGPLLARVEERLRAIAGDSGPVLSEHATGTITAGGKRLRPLLVVLAAGGADGHGVVRGAVAVELVHAATLVHDDILDAAALRRGRPTVVASAGRDLAVATGDLLFARAFTELLPSGVEAVRALGEAGSALAEGELLQRADAFDSAVSVDRYLRRCELKTACLFVAACRLGALEAGDGDALSPFARDIGLAFQILDDVLDVSGPAERTGKHRGTDLLDGTVTLPFILARGSDPSLEAPAGMTPEQAEALCDRIAATGALEQARGRALDLVARAKASLPGGLPGAQRRALDLVADSVVARYA